MLEVTRKCYFCLIFYQYEYKMDICSFQLLCFFSYLIVVFGGHVF